MTEILIDWLNNDVKLSRHIDKASLAKDFASGYLIGEIFQKFQLQDDFELFSSGLSSNNKLNNFIRLEATFNLLQIPFNANIAYDVMKQRHGVATRLLYQMYISLQRKVKNNITGAAMQTMRASATVNLEAIESGLYKERLKTLLPRESDLKLNEVTTLFQAKRKKNDEKEMASQAVILQEFEMLKQEQRKAALEKARLQRLKQSELLVRIQAATVQIPKPPPKSLQTSKSAREQMLRSQAVHTAESIRNFEKNLKTIVAPSAKKEGTTGDDSENASTEYLERIKTQLMEDRTAQEERAKRRRKVLVDQMKAHMAQEDAQRQEQVIKRLMRQSQLERRIAVQLMQARREKEVIRVNRTFRAEQYEKQRLKDFQDSLNLEASLQKLAKEEYAEAIQEQQKIHRSIMEEKARLRYLRHYELCRHTLSGIVDIASRIIEYKELTENKVPEKLVKEWKNLFLQDKPIFSPEEENADTSEVINKRIEILNDQDFMEYKTFTGEWVPALDMETSIDTNQILTHIIERISEIANPTPPRIAAPKFPSFTLRGAVVGKMFTGKTETLERLGKTHNLTIIKVEKLISEAIDACHTKEVDDSPSKITVKEETEDTEESVPSEEPKDPSEKLSKEKPVKLSERAVLGSKALEYLKAGKPVPDEILVGILVTEIHKFADGSGWLLDGFPNTIQQSKLLDKAFADTEAPDQGSEKSTTSMESGSKSKKEEKIHSGALDIVLVIDAEDDVVLKRAYGRWCARNENKTYHQEFNPPPDGSFTGIGTTEKIAPVIDEAFDKEQVQHRISAFHENWVKMEKYYVQHTPVKHVNGEQAQEPVYEEVETTLFRTLAQSKLDEKAEIERKKQEEEAKKATPPPPRASRPTSVASKRSNATSPSGSEKTKSPTGSSKDRGRKKSAGKERKSKSRSGSGKGSAKGKKKSVSPSPEVKPEPVEDDLSPKPNDPDWVYVDEPVPMECAHISVSLWTNVNMTYENWCKHIFHQIRDEREKIIRYVYESRKDYRQHLRHHDPKQTFLDAFQKNFNEVTDDLRADEETKAELHQRVDDLRERLWDICDTRKEKAEEERNALITEGWLEDHRCLMTNLYISLMQVEVDRFEAIIRLLKDYYSSMQGKIPHEEAVVFTRLPLIDLNVEIQDEAVGGNDNAAENDIEGETKPEETENRPKIPLIPFGGSFSGLIPDDGGKGKKGKGAEASGDTLAADADVEEKTIVDAYNVAVGFITSKVNADIAQKEAEEEEERRLLEEERAKAANANADKKGGGGKKKSAKGGKKGKKSKSPTPTPPTPTEDVNEEDKKKMEIASRLKDEYFAALKLEEQTSKYKLNLIRHRTTESLKELKKNINGSFEDMLEWLNARFTSEMKSIDMFTDSARHAIESSSKLKHEVRLDQDEFVVNLELKVVSTPSPRSPAELAEVTSPDIFTVDQLDSLLQHFRKVAASGFIANKSFIEILLDAIMLSFSMDNLPQSWYSVSYSQLSELSNLISPDWEYVDWRKFLLVISKPWSSPSVEKLIEATRMFREVDVAKNGWITEDLFLNVQCWLTDLHESMEASEGIEPTMSVYRANKLHSFFFNMFADWEQSPSRIDYLNMLMYFAMDEDPLHGFVRSLSCAIGEVFPDVYKVLDTSQTNPEKAKDGDLSSDASELTGPPSYMIQADPSPSPLVPIKSLWLVMHHGSSRLSDSHRFSAFDDTQDRFSMQQLRSVYEDLDAAELSPLPFQLLLQHPFIQDALLRTKSYQLPDSKVIKQVLKPVADTDDLQSVPASVV